MKKLFLSLLLVFCMVGAANALDNTGAILSTEAAEVVDYEVKITIVYNSVSALKASKLARRILEDHGEESCKVKINISKNGDRGNVYITAGTFAVTDNSATLEVR